MMSILPVDCRAMLGTVVRGNAAQYYIQSVIGEGGQGWVFKAAYDDVDGFPVVVKVLRPDTTSKDALDRFRREADTLKRLSQHNPSPFIVRFFDHGEADFPLPLAGADPMARARLPFTVLEFVYGDSLHAVLEAHRDSGLAVKRVRRILREVGKALEIVHAQNIVHRDLKPSNILISSEAGREVAKVTDFGIVKLVDVRATSTQSLAGVSLSYAPPEQYEPGNPRVGPWTDVFSFGAIVFELLTGTEAFPSNRSNPFEALRLIATARRPKLIEHVGRLPRELADRLDLVQRLDSALERALAPEPAQRPQSIAAILELVDPLLREVELKGTNDAAPSTAIQAPPLPPLAPAVTRPDSHAQRSNPSTPRRSLGEPTRWSFRLLSAGTPGARVRDAVFSQNVITTLGTAGLVQRTPQGWTAVPLAIGMLPHELHGLTVMPNGALAFAGPHGTVAFLHGGALWDVRRYPDPDVAFHAIAADPTGNLVLAVGERAGHALAVEVLSSGFRRLFEATDQGPLRAAIFADERVAFACGDAGALVRLDDQGLSRLPWERSGHLRAIAGPVQDGFVAVGTGGHALSIPKVAHLRPEIEKVMTTQDLLGVCVAPDGAAWACSANARVLRRDEAGAWRRIPAELPAPGNYLRVFAHEERVYLVGEDATIVEGIYAG